MEKRIPQWRRYELRLRADVPEHVNPFYDIKLSAKLEHNGQKLWVPGFYDGNGEFVIRHMPSELGEYRVTVHSSLPALEGATDAFTAVEPLAGEHGPVRADGMHFRHADGTPFFVMGTTAYVWHHRPAEIRQKTLASFEKYGFNKIRMLFFPKQYNGNFNKIDVSYEPPCYPFEGAPRAFDFSRPNPQYFREFEDRLEELERLGIQADVILFHPYDTGHWNLDRDMDEDDALRYVRYLIARIACYQNVWWSLANEYDIKWTEDGVVIAGDRRDWDVIGETLHARDPYKHPISCHNITFGIIYPDRPWMSHVSYQHPDTYALMIELQNRYHKPVIDDEYQYEGNLPDDWGNSSAKLEVERHWRAVMAGGYATHGEAFIRENNRDIFWAYGGEMTGESAPRLRFMKELLSGLPFEEMERDLSYADGQRCLALRKGDEKLLLFMSEGLEGKSVSLGYRMAPDNLRYRLEVYDVWNMTKVREETVQNHTRFPFTPWTALVMTRID